MDSEIKRDTAIGSIYGNYARWEAVIDYMQPIMSLYEDPTVTEIMVNRFDHILVQTHEGQKQTQAAFDSPDLLNRFIIQVASALGQKFNAESPILNARFPDDTRLCCIHDSVSPRGANITMRVARSEGGVISAEKMIDNDYMTLEMWHYIYKSYLDGKNILFSGNTGSGKTSMLRNVISELGDQERILIVEDTNEINVEHINVLNMEAAERRDLSLTMAELIKTTLRQFGSKLVVGEIRDKEAADAFIQAINTGVSGCMASVHANSARAALARIQYLIATMGYVTFELAGELVLNSIDIFVHCNRSPDYGRRVLEVVKVNKEKNKLETVYFFDDDIKKHLTTDHSTVVRAINQ